MKKHRKDRLHKRIQAKKHRLQLEIETQNKVQSNAFNRGYNSFSGVDIRAILGEREIGTLSRITYRISRQQAPIYTMGNDNPREFARGRRTIAGTATFSQFDPREIYHDNSNDNQIPPFDIVLEAANEYGEEGVMRILGVEIMDRGYGMSINDLVSEHNYTFVAQSLEPWRGNGNWFNVNSNAQGGE